MSDIAIKVEGLSKLYKIGRVQKRHDTLRDRIADARVFNLFKRRNGHVTDDGRRVTDDVQSSVLGRSNDTLWALRDVSFDVRRGEVVGIIGRNGAGKSTLLKILSRITEPTEGYADIKGRVGSLLEVGTGFHPELTGRENIYLNGSILGMKRTEINNEFDEIVAFAEIEKFLDTPVKYYSSGMYVRLAFAVAAHLEPEILLVDEVLAVGDAAFQKKCLGKMGDVAKEGRTVLFVSHTMSSIASLCGSAIWIDQGRIASSGRAELITQKYLSSIVTARDSVDLRSHKKRRGSGEARILEACIVDNESMRTGVFKHGDDVNFEFLIAKHRVTADLLCVVSIRTATGTPVLHLVSRDDPGWSEMNGSSLTRVRCHLPKCELYPGTYLVSLYIGPTHHHTTDEVEDVLQFQIEQGKLMERGFDMNWTIGIYHPKSVWSHKTN